MICGRVFYIAHIAQNRAQMIIDNSGTIRYDYYIKFLK